MLLDYIRPGMVLRQEIFDDRGSLLLEAGAVLTEAYLARLKSMGLRQIKVFDPLAASLRQSPAIPAELREELALRFRALSTIQWSQQQNIKIRYLYFQQLDSIVKNIIAHLEIKLPEIINLPVRQPTEDEVSHAVNVCLLSVITGLYLKFPAAILSDLAIGALLHDIGKTAVTEVNLPENKYLHTVYGHDILETNRFSPTITRIAAEHHERPDGSGYPMGMLGKDIHPLSRLVAVANYFDRAISNDSAGKRSRQNIVEGMMACGNSVFDLTMLRSFFQTIAIYPVGSLVKLNTGRLAYVMRNKTRLPLRPSVQLADAPYLEIDLASQPNITIEELVAE